MNADTRTLIVELCRQFYAQGWVSGTGGGISVRDGQTVYVAPSGVQKERLSPEDLFTLDRDGTLLTAPANPAFRQSACTPLFLTAYALRDAGAVIHSHGIFAMLATLLHGGRRDVFEVTHLEMMKGIVGTGYHDVLQVPIIENTAHECDLADALGDAITRYPKANAVLVRRHGVYIWGKDWVEAKTQAECYHYLFEAAVRMTAMGLRPEEVS